MSEKFCLQLTLSDDAKLIAEKDLNETEENVKNALIQLKELLENDKTIYYKIDDEFLKIFLRPCKFYATSAYELMKRIANFRAKYKTLLYDLVPSQERDAIVNHNLINVLPDRDQLGRRVMIVYCGENWNTSKVSSDQIFRLFYLIHLLAILEPDTQINGTVVIMDYKGMGLKQVAALTPAFSMKLLGFIQDAMPLRLKEIHMVNNPWIFKTVWAVFKPFIKEKLGKRIHFHENKMPSLHKFIDKSYLPKNYGGDLPEINYGGKEWYPVMEKHIDHIKEWNTYGLVEK
nr:retinaldehyde-binding protein 1-like [Onthophagus taurus]